MSMSQKFTEGPWRQRLGGCERMVDVFSRLRLDNELWMTEESELRDVWIWMEVELRVYEPRHLRITQMIILQPNHVRFQQDADLVSENSSIMPS